MDSNETKTTVFFYVQSLNIDSQYTLSNDDYVAQLSNGGFNQLGNYLIQKLIDGLNDLIKE